MLNWLGLVVAGILNGTFAVPMKKTRVWKFNQVWSLFAFLAMVVVPWAGILIAIPSWRETLAAIPTSGLVTLIVLGLVWGAASLLYGLAVDLLGVALGISIQLGLSIVVGSLVPLLLANALQLKSAGGLWPLVSANAMRLTIPFLASLAAMVLGVIVCARAGGTQSAEGRAARPHFRLGLIIAILAGIGGPLMNVGIQYGKDLLEQVGKTTPEQQWVAWAIFLSAAAVTQSGYCLLRTLTSGNARLFVAPRALADAGLVLLMSIVWAASIYFYATSANALGKLGTSFGWPIFLGLIVVTSNVWGVLLGEWRDRPRSALYRMAIGSGILVAAVFLIAQTRPM